MKQQNHLPRIIWPVIILFLLAGLLITLSETVIASAEIIITPTSSLTTTEAGGTATFTVVLFSQPTDTVTIGLSSSDTTEGTVSAATLTFTPADWSVAQTVTITGIDDLVDDGDVAYTIVTAPAVSSDPVYNQNVAGDVSVTNVDNDTAGITVSQTSGLTTTEALGTATFSVVLTSQPTADVTIGLTSSNLNEGTVLPATLTFTPADWSVAQTVTVTGVDDFIDDGDIAYTIVTTASSADSIYNAIDPADVSVTNQDNDTVGITVNPTSGLITNEASGTATFTVVLTSQPTADVTIGLSSSDTTEGTVAPPSLTFTSANWSTTQTVTVTGVDDPVADGAIAYTIVTAPATSTDPAYNSQNPADVSVTNQDNDTAGITVNSTPGLTTTEAGGTATFSVVLTSQPIADVTIGLSSSDTTEGTVTPLSLIFTSANWSTAQTVTVTGLDDPVADGAIAYTIVTAPATSTDPAYNGQNPPDVSVTNQDNDTAGITVSPTSGLITNEASGTATFTVVLTSQPTANVTIALSSADTTEGTVSPSSLTFTQANWSAAQTVTVTGVDDLVVDGNIVYTIVTAAAASVDLAYNGLNPPDVSVTNTDNDTAGITVSPTSGLVTTEAGDTATFTVVLTSQPTANVTIGLSSSDTTEGIVSPASLTFTSDTWSAAQSVTVTGADDPVADGNIIYAIVTAPATSTDPAYNSQNPADVSVTNQDNDTAAITVSPTSGLVTIEAGETATFTVVLTSQPTANVTIGLSSSDTTEGTVAPPSLTFTSANWSTAQTVTVTGVDDLVVDGNIVYTIVTAASVSADLTYNGLNPADVSVTNQDNDTAGFTVSQTSGLTTTEAGVSATFTVRLTSQPTADVTIGLSSSDTTEGTVLPVNLTFTSANWSFPQTVTVTGVDDPVDDGDIAYTISTTASSGDLIYNALNPADVSVINQDNDTAGITVSPISGLTTTEAGGTATFTVALNSQPTANVNIGLSSSLTTEGTVSPVSLTFTAANWSVAQQVTVTGVNDSIDDGDIPYTIVTTASSGDSIYNALNPADVSVTNQDNDTAGIPVSPTSGLTTTEAGGTTTFTVVLTSQPLANVTIALSSSDTTEGTVAPPSLIFTQANWNTPQEVTVTGVDDFVDDGDVLYTIVTAAAVSTDTKYGGIDPSDVSVTNTDNDTAGFIVNPTAGLTTTEAGGKATFTIRLASQPTGNVTIGLSSSNTNEGTVSPASLIFTPGTWGGDQTVTVTGVDDFIDDGDNTYTIVTASAVSSDSKYGGVNPHDVTVTNQDDDTAGFSMNPTLGLNTSEVGSEVTFTVVLTSQPLANVTIGLSSSDAGEGTVLPVSLIFTPVNWSISQTATVTGVDDMMADGPIPYQIITSVTNGDSTYIGLNPPDVSLINQDNDTAGITVNPTSGLITTEAGGTDTFTVVLNTQPTVDVTIVLSSSDTTEATASPAGLTFTAANWSAAQTVTVTGMNDPEDDGDQLFTIFTGNAGSTDSSYSGMIVPDVSGTNVNNDFTPVAVGDFYLTNATPLNPLKIDPPGVLANDTDANHDILSAQIVTPPLLGTLTLSPNGSFVYTPDDISNNSWSDSFKYRVNDGYLDSPEATVGITMDRIVPIVNWVTPVPDGEIYEPADRYVWLEAAVIENNAVRQVNFFRWDAAGKKYVDIGVVFNSPFRWYLDTQTLNYQWNQVFVTVTDGAGNVSTLPFIWIFRDLPMQMFLPVISR